MSTGPTRSGIATRVLPAIPRSMFVTLGQLAAHGGYNSIGEMQADIERGDAPELPHAHRIGGQHHFDALYAQDWLDQLSRLRDRAPERAAARAKRDAQEAQDREERQRDREAKAMQASRERQAMFRAIESEAQAREAAEAAAQRARPVIAPLKGIES